MEMKMKNVANGVDSGQKIEKKSNELAAGLN
jgi:hypothetical protein